LLTVASTDSIRILAKAALVAFKNAEDLNKNSLVDLYQSVAARTPPTRNVGVSVPPQNISGLGDSTESPAADEIHREQPRENDSI